jgi:DNA-binding transcriptional MerR regulator
MIIKTGNVMKESTPAYNLKAVIHETGLTPATLRAWERRYGLIRPQRSPGGHRLYSQKEIDMLKWLVARQAEGLSISHAVEMWRSRGNQAALQPEQRRLTIAPASGSILDALRHDWIIACASFDDLAAEQTLAQAFAIAAPEVVCMEVLQKGLAEIGAEWYSGKASVQQEHFASALAMRRLYTLFAAAPLPTQPARILAACPPGEMHEFSLLILAYLLRRRGWDVVYLGTNVPISHLDTAIQRISPRLILSVAQTLSSAAALREMANYAIEQGVALVYGGGIFNSIPSLHDRIPGYFLGNKIGDVPQQVEFLLAQPIKMPEPQVISFETHELLVEFAANEALIIADVTAALQPMHIEPAYLEEANENFTRSLVAAMKLGDTGLLDYSVNWLVKMLDHYGLSPSLAVTYCRAYQQAVQNHLGERAAPIIGWLAKVELTAA